ncbi:NADPH:quinone reductase [bacterium]|nr:MAG: NADPH:quinone reductase [bacterium]
MKAVVVENPGAPEVLQIKEVSKPSQREGWVLIKVKAFGLNRSEMFTRQGHSPNVKFPRILGIECVGIVQRCPSGNFAEGQKVAAIMGEMGRSYDGSYAEYTLVPENIVFDFESTLDWEILGAIPEMFQTVNGSLDNLEVKAGDIFLIRGGTSSIGMTACQIAKSMGATVIATTRNPDKEEALKQNGADHIIIDDGQISEKLRVIYPDGADKVLELIGTITIKDSLKCVRPKGIVCITGILGNEWLINNFEPMVDIPSTVRLTCYSGEAMDLDKSDLQDFINKVEKGKIKLNIDRVFQLEEIVQAHQYMESNQAKGKIVVRTGDVLDSKTYQD